MPKTDYLLGEKYNLLTIKKIIRKKVGSNGRNIIAVECLCDCGGKTITTITKLRSGHTKSCGCLWIKVMNKHGQSYTKTYNSWSLAKDRCNNFKNRSYNNYGGRGITFDKGWNNFIEFYKDMGDKPFGASLDRINNNKGYYKENCRWATKEEQSNNTRRNIILEYNGEKNTIARWAKKTNIKYATLQIRIFRGWDIKRALKTKTGKYVFNK